MIERAFNKDNPAVVLGMFETGLGVGRSLGRKGIEVIGVDFKKDIGFYSKYINACICPHPLEEEEKFIEFLVALSKRKKEKPALFITSDDFLLSITKNREHLSEYFLMNFPEKQIVESVIDKFQQYLLVKKIGIPLPKTFFPENMTELNEIKKELSYPVFVKAQEVNVWRKNISSSLKGFLITKEHDLMNTFRAIFEKNSRAIVQEVVQGPDTNHFKICCYLSREGTALLAFTLQKIRQLPVRFGVGAVVRSVHYPRLLDVGKKLFTAIKYRGVGSAEFKLDAKDQRLKLIELNPRYWQQNILSERCGMNFPFIDYLEVTGQNPEPIYRFYKGVKWVNIYMDFNSYLTYQRDKELTLNDWLNSLRGMKVYSDFARDDILPAFYEIRFGKRLFRLPRYVLNKLKDGK